MMEPIDGIRFRARVLTIASQIRVTSLIAMRDKGSTPPYLVLEREAVQFRI